MSVDVKICGLRTLNALIAAVEGGAAMVGFVFFAKSPRFVSPQQAAPLADKVPDGVLRVGLMVDPHDDYIDEVLDRVSLDILQLHGRETPGRVREIKQKFRIPVMKALPIAEPADVVAARSYEKVSDYLLFDAKPPKDATRPGGNAEAFDWALLASTKWAKPWLLAGGLTAENVARAVAISGAQAVDVSSGVESAPGEKSVAKIRAFLDAAAEAGE